MKKLDSDQSAGSKPGAARRLLRLASLIRQQLGQVISREVELPKGAFLTITAIKVLADYSEVRVGLSIWPSTQAVNVLAVVERRRGELQKFLNEKLTMYRVPRLVFYLDTTADRVQQVERLLDNIATE